MARLDVELTQNTPIMHFQYDQAGATIRGSELKPRLDNFLRKYAFNSERNNYGRYTVGYTENSTEEIRSDALDYRVRIVMNGFLNTRQLDKNDNTPYFDMKNDKNKTLAHQAAWTNDGVSLTFMSKHEDLLEVIKENIVCFFAITNFGFRKGKGFGSFTVKRIGNEQIFNTDYNNVIKTITDRLDNEYEQTLFVINARGNKGAWLEIEKVIQQECINMVTGMGRTNQRQLSILMRYAYQREVANYSNEKRKMKEEIESIRMFNPYCRNERNERIDTREEENRYPGEFRFIRAMLGLADHYVFDHDKIYIEVDHVLSNGEENTSQIQRFESPLLFKPIYVGDDKWKIYIILRKIPDRMYGQTFSFEEKNGNKASFTIETPSIEEFNLVEFTEMVASIRSSISRVD